MKNTLRTPHFLTLIASLGLVLAPVAGCGEKGPGDESAEDETAGDGDGDPGDGDGDQTGDGDGDPTGDGDGDGDPTTGDGDGDQTGDGDGEPEMCEPGSGTGAPNGQTCTSDGECDSCNCYVVPLLSGQCGECNEDADCADITMGGCTPPNPFEANGSVCNMGEAGGGCESSDVCQEGLSCGTVLDVAGIITIDTCGECTTDADCPGEDPEATLCAPVVSVQEFSGVNTCIVPGTLEQDAFCNIGENGDAACGSGICSTVDIMGLAQVGACGQCNTDDDCTEGGTCMPGAFDIGAGALTGSICQ